MLFTGDETFDVVTKLLLLEAIPVQTTTYGEDIYERLSNKLDVSYMVGKLNSVTKDLLPNL
jgi:hypothetical protein